MYQPSDQKGEFAGMKKNILFIMSDDHAANAISLYGSRLARVMKTPYIDSIGREGAWMENCFCTNAVCTPSRASILTGQHSHVNGVRTLFDSLDESAVTFPQLLRENGYQTAVIGKWHLHSRPRHFDHFDVLGYPWQQGLYFDPEFLDESCDWESALGPDVAFRTYHGKMEKGYVTDIITDKCIEWLTMRDPQKPFLLLCHHKAPHDEFEYHPRYEHLLDGVEIPMPESMFEDKSLRCDGSKDFGITISETNRRRNMVETMMREDYPTGPLKVDGLDEEERTKAAYQKFLKDYLRTVKGIDDNVGRLLDWLKQNGLYEETIIVYTSDQGMLLGEHDYSDKRWIFEESMQMPFLIRVPGEVEGNGAKKCLASNLDFAPTLLDYAQVDVPEGMQGKSFRKLLCQNGDIRTKEEICREEVYYRYWLHMTHCDTPAHYGIRTRDFKLVFYYGLALDAKGALPDPTPSGWELYDLQKDPYEMHNVYNDPAYSETADELKRRLKRMKEECMDPDDNYPEVKALSGL